MDNLEEGINNAEVQPEYDMEFARYGPNPIELPMSPPRTPSPDAHDPEFRRELSPFSVSSSMTSVDSMESVGYFREEGGRMFPAMPNVPVVLPVDREEMRRISGQYDLLKLISSDRHYEEINGLLNPPHKASIRVLNVISNSPWIDDMAQEYPHTSDYKFWLREWKRLLRPGGILVAEDLEMATWNCDGSDPWQSTPMVCQFVDRMHMSLLAQGIDNSCTELVGSWLHEIGGFSEIDNTVTSIPIGGWDTDELQQEIGNMARDNFVSALLTVSPHFRRAGTSQEQIDEMLVQARAELSDSDNIIFQRLFYTFARKEEAELDVS
ncbi:hypothetical protein EW145_g3560 [Phellinidium pouzarii]|uniref:Uncharacterized protein n=1 Tax=Phellinidium pouzarii TaxID=167371 RepID=A0A4S4L872_9AGAM|nr:hypothetical protein EW145_g3560 [Phellinidium pouzarii]